MSNSPPGTRRPLLNDSALASSHVKDVPEPVPPELHRSAAGPVSACCETTRCLLLHAGLVLVHLILVLVWSQSWEHRAVLDIEPGDNVLQTGITLSLSALGVAYSALLTYDAQRLALRRGIHLRQTITAVHDRMQAWLGLGSALNAVKQQGDLETSARLGVRTITCYLLCIFVFHNTAPALLNLETFDAMISGPVSVQLLPSSDNISLSIPYAFLPALSLYPQTQTPGLSSNIVYDSLAFAADETKLGPGNVTVNATTFLVSCDVMPALGQTYGVNVSEGFNTSYWNISLPSGPQVIYEQSAPFVLRIPRNILVGSESGLRPASTDLIVMATFNVSSAGGGPKNSVHLDPVMKLHAPRDFVYDLSFLICSLSQKYSVAKVDMAGDLVELLPPPSSFTSIRDFNYSDSPAQVPWTELWSELVSWGISASASGLISPFTDADLVNTTLPAGLGIPEEWLMNSVGLSTAWSGDPSPVSVGNPYTISVQDIEAGLADLTAAMYWSAITIGGGGSASVELGLTPGNWTEQQLRLNITPIPLFSGLAASILLTGVCYLLVRHVPDATTAHKAVEGAGLLQWIYLLGHAQTFPEEVVAVDDPTEYNLRRAGMQEIWAGVEPGTRRVRRRSSSVQ